MRPGLDFRGPARWLAVAAPLVAILFLTRSRHIVDYVIVASLLAWLVALLYEPLYAYCKRGPGSRTHGQLISSLTIVAMFAPLLLAGAFHGATTPTIATSAAVLVVEIAWFEALRRRAGGLASPRQRDQR